MKYNCNNSHLGCYECYVETNYNDKIICIDKCLLQELQQLWFLGIKTVGCCCGKHFDSKNQSGYIQVQDEYVDKMVKLGYKKIINEFNKPIFIPKSIDYEIYIDDFVDNLRKTQTKVKTIGKFNIDNNGMGRCPHCGKLLIEDD